MSQIESLKTKKKAKKIFLLLGQRKSKVMSDAENKYLPKTGIIFVIEKVMCPSSKHLIINL